MRPATCRIRWLPLLGLALAGIAQAADPPVPTTGPTTTAATLPASPVATQHKANSLSLEATAIRGNQELPKVLYIVPWKDPAAVELSGRPVNSLIEELLAPVDREVFRRQTRYFSQLYGAESAMQATTAPGGHPAATDSGATDQQQSGTTAAGDPQD